MIGLGHHSMNNTKALKSKFPGNEFDFLDTGVQSNKTSKEEEVETAPVSWSNLKFELLLANIKNIITRLYLI